MPEIKILYIDPYNCGYGFSIILGFIFKEKIIHNELSIKNEMALTEEDIKEKYNLIIINSDFDIDPQKIQNCIKNNEDIKGENSRNLLYTMNVLFPETPIIVFTSYTNYYEICKKCKECKNAKAIISKENMLEKEDVKKCECNLNGATHDCANCKNHKPLISQQISLEKAIKDLVINNNNQKAPV